jgi:lysophospholipase L1-like esterase
MTGRPVSWRANGLSGATARKGLQRLVPLLPSEDIDLIIVAFGGNDVMTYRSPRGFVRDIEKLVSAARERVGEAAVVIAGVAPLTCFPALPSPLRNILGWRSAALHAALERLPERFSKLSVERFRPRLDPSLFATDGFHINAHAHDLWGEEIAALAMPLLAATQKPRRAAPCEF